MPPEMLDRFLPVMKPEPISTHSSPQTHRTPRSILLGLGIVVLIAVFAATRARSNGSETAKEPVKEVISPPAGPDGWLTGNPHEKFDKLAAQQRGFDQAMWEIGYRYRELAWAGKQQDWKYANYQIVKIQLTLEQAMERRPKRAENARMFIAEGIQPMKQALAKEPVQDFPARFQQLTTACLACHGQEQAPIMDLPAWAARDPSFPPFH
jgi:cytochrome c553